MPDYESGFRQVPSDPSIGIFAGENLPTCPFCRSEIPAWTTRETYGLTTRVLFRCGQCAAVFSVTAADIMGRSDSIMSVAGLIKALHGKRNHSYYARVEVPGMPGGCCVSGPRIRDGDALHTAGFKFFPSRECVPVR